MRKGRGGAGGSGDGGACGIGDAVGAGTAAGAVETESFFLMARYFDCEARQDGAGCHGASDSGHAVFTCYCCRAGEVGFGMM